MPDTQNTPSHDADENLDAVKKAAAGGKLDPEEAVSATNWFLADDPESAATKTIQLNVGVAEPLWVDWTVRAIDRDVIREIRQRAQGRRSRGVSEVDELNVSLYIAVAGTVTPDLTSGEVRKAFGAHGVDPSDALKYRFRNKPGLIDKIAEEVLAASGYDEADVREVTAGKL